MGGGPGLGVAFDAGAGGAAGVCARHGGARVRRAATRGLDRRSRPCARASRRGRFAAGALVVGGRAAAAAGGQRRPGARCAGARSGGNGRGGAGAAGQRSRPGGDGAWAGRCCVLHLLHAESGASNDPYVRRLLAGAPSCSSICGSARWVGCAARQPACSARVGDLPVCGLPGARRAVDCGCSGAADGRGRRRGGARQGEPACSTSRWPPQWRRAPPTAGLAVRAVARACDLDFVASRRALRAGAGETTSTARPGCSRGCIPAFTPDCRARRL